MTVLVPTDRRSNRFSDARQLTRLTRVAQWLKTLFYVDRNKRHRVPAHRPFHEVPPYLLKDAGIDPANVHVIWPDQIRPTAMSAGPILIEI